MSLKPLASKPCGNVKDIKNTLRHKLQIITEIIGLELHASMQQEQLDQTKENSNSQ